MNVAYGHTNIIAENWRLLADFYIHVFSCVEVPPRRQQSGQWLAMGTGVQNAELEGVHLRLPGFGDKGPTLEIYTYKKVEKNLPPVANRKGFGHIAFTVDDVAQIVNNVTMHGGSLLGKVVQTTVQGVGELTFVYVQDPEGNIVEVQNWKRRPV